MAIALNVSLIIQSQCKQDLRRRKDDRHQFRSSLKIANKFTFEYSVMNKRWNGHNYYYSSLLSEWSVIDVLNTWSSYFHDTTTIWGWSSTYFISFIYENCVGTVFYLFSKLNNKMFKDGRIPVQIKRSLDAI